LNFTFFRTRFASEAKERINPTALRKKLQTGKDNKKAKAT
jgi:hypothetical protein